MHLYSTIDSAQCLSALPLSGLNTDLDRFLDAIGDERDSVAIVGAGDLVKGKREMWRYFPASGTVKREKKRGGVYHLSGGEQPLESIFKQYHGISFRPNHIGVTNETWEGSRVLFCEWDDLAIAEQWEQVQRLRDMGLAPTAIVHSGGKSLHVYVSLDRTITDPEHWLRLMRKLAVVMGSDPAICTLNREMRLPGGVRFKNGEWKEQTLLETHPENRYSPEAIEAVLDAGGMFPLGLDGPRFTAWKRAKTQRKKLLDKLGTATLTPGTFIDYPREFSCEEVLNADEWKAPIAPQPYYIDTPLEHNADRDRALILENAYLLPSDWGTPGTGSYEQARNFAWAAAAVLGDYEAEALLSPLWPQRKIGSLIRSRNGKDAGGIAYVTQALKDLGFDVKRWYQDWFKSHPEQQSDRHILTAIDGGGNRKKKSKAQRRRERKAMQAREVHHAILHPWGDREVTTVNTAAEAIEFLRNHSHVMIDGATGAGKTELIAEFLKYLEKNGKSKSDFFAFTPIRSLARAAAAKFDIPYRGCVHSILAIAPVMLRRDKPIAVFDEVEQNLTALLKSSLCQKDRGQKVAMHSQAVQHCERVILASATASNKDVEYFEAITGKTFKILRYSPPVPRKGTLKIYQGDPDVKGSARASKNKVLGSITPRSYVAADSLEVAMGIEKRLTGDIQTGELAPVLACSKTGDDDLVKAIISSPRPGDVLAGLGCPGIIATPYVQSGVSFQNPVGMQLFDRVVGVFGGNTVAPSDAFQQLERYRSDIDRHVYAPESAQPPQRLARGFAPKGSTPRSKRVTAQWRSDVDNLEAQIRTTGAYRDFEFVHGPERDWCQKWEAQMQLEYRSYGAALAGYAQRNGYEVEWETCTDAAEVQDYRDDVRRALAAKISNSRPIDYFEFRRLLEKPEPTIAEQDEIEAYLIRDYYGLEWDAPLSIEQVLEENFGKGRKQLKAALRSAFAGVAADDDRKHREKLGDTGFVWDATAYELEQQVSDELGLDDVLTYCIAGNPRGTHIPQIRDFADRLAAMQDTLGEGSKLFGHAIPWRNPDNPTRHYGDTVKWLGMILSNKFGIRSTSTKHRTPEGIVTVYHCRQDDIDRVKAAIERKAGSLIDKGFHPRSTPLGKIFTQGVDHPPPTVVYCGMHWYFARRNGENFICVADADPTDPNEWLLAPADLAA